MSDRRHLTSHPKGDDGSREKARLAAREVVAAHNPTGGYNLPDLGRPTEDYQRGGERYLGSSRHLDDLANAIERGCDPRTESCPPGMPIPAQSRRRCRPCGGRRCRR